MTVATVEEKSSVVMNQTGFSNDSVKRLSFNDKNLKTAADKVLPKIVKPVNRLTSGDRMKL